ncbi:translation initiation factor eIF2 assembly protein-like [Periplaneta americana]|uniref:translation initiation factor eIF2 assembly protein-like n=1 Tax=Periplaneta americana TaxID=6978 RepID=UPI0037E8ECDC
MIITSDTEACSFQNWYHLFKDHSIESVTIPIDENVVNYLLEDSTLVLPEEVCNTSSERWSEHEGDSLDLDHADEPSSEIKPPSFPSFSKALKDGINKLGGAVFIKLNWRAPQDAAWITSTKSLKCTSIEDIYLLLKSSDIITEDLTYNIYRLGKKDNCHIVLKRWQEIDPGNEFRCFVCKQQLIAISQRDYKIYYGHLAQTKYQIMEEISAFFKENITGKFPLSNYVFDIVRYSSNRIKIVDFSPFDPLRTLPLLFTWGDLCAMERNLSAEMPTIEFRILGEDPGIIPNPIARYGFPQDIINLSASGNNSAMDNIISEVEAQASDERNEEDF